MFNLYPVLNYAIFEEFLNDDPLLDLLDPNDRDESFKHFYPRYTADAPKELTFASHINVAFVFQKRTNQTVGNIRKREGEEDLKQPEKKRNLDDAGDDKPDVMPEIGETKKVEERSL